MSGKVFNMVGGGAGSGIKLASIAITTPPSKTAYKVGETFSTANMVVTATYDNGATAVATGYNFTPSGALTLADTQITIQYTEGGVTKTATQAITVTRTQLAIPTQSGTLTYSGSPQSPSWSNYDAGKMTVGGTTSGTNAGSYTATFALSNTTLYEWADGTTAVKSVSWSIAKAAGSLSISPTSLALNATTPTGTISVTRAGNGAISVSSSNTSVATVSLSGTTVTVTGIANGSATITVSVAAGTNHNAPANKTCAVTVSFVSIYGVSWDGTSTTAFSRTDDAAGFTNPVAYMSGLSNYGSPFDNLYPWSGMVRSTDAQAGELVAIPKYWYKWTKSGNTMTLKIADSAVDGYLVSPAHADRGDGKGERDVVYVGRYHCGATAFKSISGQLPKVSVTRAGARSAISSLGATIWQYDFAMYWTIMMLYLVEYADWDCQTKIGYGCGNGSALQAVGASDAMPYHTGTMQSARTAYGVGCQYRNIEGLWESCFDWCDGIYFSGTNVYCIKNPASFSDTSGGTLVGTRPSTGAGGFIVAWSIPTATGFEYALYPSNVTGGSDATYIPDSCSYSSSGVVLCCGGDYGRYLYRGLFGLYGDDAASDSYGSIGCRLQKLP